MVQLSAGAARLLHGETAMRVAAAGGKGAALAKLAADFNVPAFFVIPAEAFDDSGLKADITDELHAALAGLGPGPYAVRSSGREEDGADSAHAGQFESELNVPVEEVAFAAHRVWRSGFSETLAQYRRAKGLSEAPQPPSVVVQVMVKARAAGVAFSADPVSGDVDVAVVSAILGLADKLVGGQADGDTYRIDKAGRTLEADLVGAAPVLTERERAGVADLARRAARHFGSPQDIEWAFDGLGLHLLQSRPITTLGAPERARPQPSAPPPVPIAAAPPQVAASQASEEAVARRAPRVPFPAARPGGLQPEPPRMNGAAAQNGQRPPTSPILRGGPAGLAAPPMIGTFQDSLDSARGAATPEAAKAPVAEAPAAESMPAVVERQLPVVAEAWPPPAPPAPPQASVVASTAREERLPTPATASPRIESADEQLTIWDNSNIVESYPGVTSPLTFSFARYSYRHVYEAFSSLMGVSRRTVEDHRSVFENMLGRVDGRVYYNLLNWYRALALFPGFKANRRFMEGMMGVSEALPQEMADAIAPPTRNVFVQLLDNLNLLRVGLGLAWHQLWIRGTIRKFYKRLNQALATPDAAIDAMQPTQLAAEYRHLEQQLLARWDAPLINDFLCMIAFGAAQKAMSNAAGEEGHAFLSSILIGQGDIISAEPARLIREMGAMAKADPELIRRLDAGEVEALGASPALKAKFDAYIARFGDRCTQELKLESRTLHEDPSQVLMAIAGAARSQPRAETHPAQMPDAFSDNMEGPVEPAGLSPKARLKRLIPNPWSRFWATRLLSWSKSRVRDRENLRFERTRLFGRVRRIFLALGARFAETGVLPYQRDVFSLTVDELLGAVEGGGITSDLKMLAALREGELQEQLGRPDPPERFSVRGPHILGVATLTAQPRIEPTETSEIRKGVACCRGVIEAPVRVIEDPRTEALAPGEILVARHTDPGWIAVFANAAGVIAERGSLLSHSAIVAREMGVPCVVALKGATQWLKTGDIVRLDGGAGTVERTAKVG